MRLLKRMKTNELINNGKVGKQKKSIYVCPNCRKSIITLISKAEFKMNLKTPQGKLRYVFCSEDCLNAYKNTIRKGRLLLGNGNKKGNSKRRD